MIYFIFKVSRYPFLSEVDDVIACVVFELTADSPLREDSEDITFDSKEEVFSFLFNLQPAKEITPATASKHKLIF